MEKETIIQKSKITHTIKYDYSLLSNEHKLTENVPIICQKHGLFRPRLGRFLNGSNCPHCSGKTLKSKEMFVKEANEIHNDFFKYEDFEYINSHTKSFITCPIHGNFKQTPTNHLNGNGCPRCKTEKLSKLFASKTEDFIEKANKVHDSKYIYNKTVYINNTTPCTITCSIHGDFTQAPHNHLSGKGCPLCNQSHLESEVEKFLNENNIEFVQQKRFEWLGKQSLDFYLPQYNIALECQGKQHFEAINKFGGEEGLKIIQERDERKRNLCKENGINLLYYSNLHIDYPYKVYEDLKEIIKEIKNIPNIYR